jgi:serine/threonine protein kinase
VIGVWINGRYRITSVLGQGGMGEVFVAKDEHLQREVVLKRIVFEHRHDPELRQRLYNEARSVALLNHRNAVDVYDCILADDGTVWIVMPRLLGRTLTEWIARWQNPNATVVVALARQLAAVLDAMHVAKMVHRDVKPDNILLVNDPEARCGLQLKLIDFGLVKLAEEHQPRVKTLPFRHGSPGYAAPEQFNPPYRATKASDIYAFGCVMFELLTGTKVKDHPPGTPPSAIRATLAHEVDLVILRALAEDPGTRPATASEIAHVLEVELLRERDVPTVPPVGRPPTEELGAMLGEGAWAYVFAYRDDPDRVAKVARLESIAGREQAEHWWIETAVLMGSTVRPSAILRSEGAYLRGADGVFARLLDVTQLALCGQPRTTLVLERIHGRSMAQLIDANDGAAAVAAMPATIDALVRIAATGSFHGDIKPANVMVEPNGRVRFVDPTAGFFDDYHALLTPIRNPLIIASDVPALAFMVLELLTRPRIVPVAIAWPEVTFPPREHVPYRGDDLDVNHAFRGWLFRREPPAMPQAIDVCLRCIGAFGPPPPIEVAADQLLRLLPRP